MHAYGTVLPYVLLNHYYLLFPILKKTHFLFVLYAHALVCFIFRYVRFSRISWVFFSVRYRKEILDCVYLS